MTDVGEAIRKARMEETEVVEMGKPRRYGWECSLCQGQTGLEWERRERAEEELANHLRHEHETTRMAVCTCYYDCAEDPAAGCSRSGAWHVHAGEKCPVHPDALGDH